MTVAEAAPFEGPLFSTQTAPQERIFPKLSPGRFERLAARGRLRPVAAGEVLIEAGVPVTHLFLVKSGRLDVVRPTVMPGAARAERLVTSFEAGQFTGEASLLSGRRGLGLIRVARGGRGVRDRSRGALVGDPDRQRPERDPDARLHPATSRADRPARRRRGGDRLGPLRGNAAHQGVPQPKRAIPTTTSISTRTPGARR